MLILRDLTKNGLGGGKPWRESQLANYLCLH